MSADEREVADAIWTLDDDGILDAIETSVSPGVARAVRTLIAGYAAPPGDDRGRELTDEINARADEADPPVATVGVSTLRRWATTVRALPAPPAPETEAVRAALVTLIDEIGAEVGVPPGQPVLVLTQVRGWMEHARRTNAENERLRAATPPAAVHDPTTEDEDGRCTEYPDLIDRHGARWVWAIGSEYRARHVLGGWKCRDVGYIRGVFGPVTEVPAAAPEGEAGSDRPWTSRELGDRNAADRMETWLREDKPSRVLDQWTEDLERLIVAARHGRRQPAAADSPSFTCPCGTVREPCPGPEDRPLCMRYGVSREDRS